jgi:NAD(P)-dependent dehydrogenase (short-subunit alcohol dehydrogenase family)
MTDGIAARVVVITGASKGIGSELARFIAHRGARLGLLARSEAALKDLASQLPTEALPVACDVSDETAVADGFKAVADRFGGIDSVIANVGISPAAHRGHNLPLEIWQEVLDVNLTGTFLTARAAYPYLATSGRGRLVLTSSVMAAAPRRGLAAYAASKAGIEGLTRALATDWASAGITVNAIAAGFIDAGLGAAFSESDRLRPQVLQRTLAGRFGTADELAAAICYLASDSSSYLTGQVLRVDGGYGLG